MPSYHYYQLKGGEEVWRPSPVIDRERLEVEDKPVFITVLAVSRLIDESADSDIRMTHEEKLKLAYEGPFYADWDSEDEQLVIEKVNQFLDELVKDKVDLEMCKLFATGGRGYHIEIPQKVFMEKLPPKGTIGLPSIYREMALELAVDTMDLKIYSGGRGRMWRTPNVQRTNGRYKVSITAQEMREMTPERCRELTSSPRAQVPVRSAVYCANMITRFNRAKQKVDALLEKRKRFKPDPDAAKRAQCDSIVMAMAGFGVRPDAGFQELATQLAIAATTAGVSEDQFVADCQGLIQTHVSDGNRYGSEAKRTEELRRMHRYMDGNMCYEFSIGAIKNLLTHPAPDLDGITITREELEEEIKTAEAEESTAMDEYKDVAKGLSLTKFGIWKDTEFGKKRICAVSFTESTILLSMEGSQVVGYESDILVNGTRVGRQMLEMEVMSGLTPFSRFTAKYGHAFQGSDADVRTTMMRFVEQTKKKGSSMYVTKREGLDVLTITTHDVLRCRDPFLVWSDHNGVLTTPDIVETGLKMVFQGFPDPRGVFRTDIANAPNLAEWLQTPENKASLRMTLENLMTCQRADLLGKLIGWHVSCFWKQLFQIAYHKFPLLHVNGPAGVGKTENMLMLSSFFNYRTEPRPTSPSSTTFSMVQQMTASASIPLIIDEYKPTEMKPERHNAMKALFRDAYNQRIVSRGGGTRESEDYRSLHNAELSAPLIFVAEAAEDEAAVMERVVLATFSRPPQVEGLRNLAKFQLVSRNREQLGIMGQYIAARILRTATIDSFRDEFDALYETAKTRYLLTEEDLAGGISEEELLNKQNAKERSVYNHTVAKFGFIQFRKLVNEVYADADLDATMGRLEDGIYDRLADLNAATTPEHIKVLAEIAQITHHVDHDRPEAIRPNLEYAFVEHGSRSCVEIAMVPAYGKYRLYCRNTDMKAYFQTKDAFMLSVRDSPAYVKHGTGDVLQLPMVYTFDLAELAKFGVAPFKAK